MAAPTITPFKPRSDQHFDGQNFESYSRAIKGWANINTTLRKILEGTTKIPPTITLAADGSNEAAVAAREVERDLFKSYNGLIYYALQTTMTSDSIISDVEVGDGYTAWEKLTRIYQSTSRASIKQMIQALLQTKQRGRETGEFLAELYSWKKQNRSCSQLFNHTNQCVGYCHYHSPSSRTGFSL